MRILESLIFNKMESLQQSFIEKSIGYISVCLLAVLPFIMFQKYFYMGVSSKAVVLFVISEILILLVGLVFVFLNNKKNKNEITWSPLYTATLVFLVVYIVTAIFGVDVYTSFWSKATRMTGIFFFLHVVLFSWVVYFFITKKEWFIRFISVLFFSGLVFSILSNLGDDGLHWSLFSYKLGGDGFTIGNSTFAGTFLLMTFFIGLWWVWGIEGVKRIWWHKVLPFLMLVNPMFINIELLKGNISIPEIIVNPFIIIGEARAAALSVFLGAFIWLVYSGIKNIKKISLRKTLFISSGVGVLLIVIFSVISIAQPNGLLRNKFEELSGGARPLVWNIASHAIAERPIFGWGPDNFDRAFIQHFDNRLFLPEYGGEVWFDRAHNIFIDTLVDMGIVGLIAYLALYASALYMLIKIWKSGTEAYQNFAVIGGLLLILHILEIQTAFDTVISYIILGIIFVFIHTVYVWNNYGKKFILSSFVVASIGIVLIVSVPFAYTQTHRIIVSNRTNGDVRTIGSSAERLKLYPRLFASAVDKPSSLWRTTTDLERGILGKPSVLSEQNKVVGFSGEFAYIGNEYDEYLAKNPNDFRALLNRADTLLFVRLFGEDYLIESKKYVDQAQALVPQHPLPYIMDSVIAVYQNDFKSAYKYIEQAKAVNPDIEYTKLTEEWIKKQEKTFPEVDFRFIEHI